MMLILLQEIDQSLPYNCLSKEQRNDSLASFVLNHDVNIIEINRSISAI